MPRTCQRCARDHQKAPSPAPIAPLVERRVRPSVCCQNIKSLSNFVDRCSKANGKYCQASHSTPLPPHASICRASRERAPPA